MDATDRRIIGALVADGRQTLHELATTVHLGTSATRDRVRRLEKTGVITGYTALVDDRRLGFAVDALVDVDVPAGVDEAAFRVALEGSPEVVEALHATGGSDYVVRVRCADTGALHRFVRGLKADHGASRTHTRVVLDQTVARRTPLP